MSQLFGSYRNLNKKFGQLISFLLNLMNNSSMIMSIIANYQCNTWKNSSLFNVKFIMLFDFLKFLHFYLFFYCSSLNFFFWVSNFSFSNVIISNINYNKTNHNISSIFEFILLVCQANDVINLNISFNVCVQ